jgi:hypothetical protein
MNQDAIGYSWLFLESARTRLHIYMQHLQTFVETTDYASLHYCSCKGLEIFQAQLRGAAPSLCTVQSDYSSISISFKMYHEIVLHSRSQHIPCPKLQARAPPQRHRKGSSKSFNLQQKNSRQKFKSDQRTRKMQPLRIPARGPLHKSRGGGGGESFWQTSTSNSSQHAFTFSTASAACSYIPPGIWDTYCNISCCV